VSDLYDDEMADDLPPASPYGEFESEHLLLRLRDIVEDAPKVPLSSSAMVSKEEVLELLDEVIDRLPDELRAARWLLKERDEFLTKVRHEGEEIVNQARSRAEQLVQRTEVIRSAEQRAYEIVDQAEAEARRLQHEVEDFCDQKLASFEIVLERTLQMVAAGREKLQGTDLTAGIPIDEYDEEGEEGREAAYAAAWGEQGATGEPAQEAWDAAYGADTAVHGDDEPSGEGVAGDYGDGGYGESTTADGYAHLPPPPDQGRSGTW
jgi:cell division septum initiation protein DivIVA